MPTSGLAAHTYQIITQPSEWNYNVNPFTFCFSFFKGIAIVIIIFIRQLEICSVICANMYFLKSEKYPQIKGDLGNG